MRIFVLLTLLIASPSIAGNADQPPKKPKPAAKCGSGCSGTPPNCNCPAAKPTPRPIPARRQDG